MFPNYADINSIYSQLVRPPRRTPQTYQCRVQRSSAENVGNIILPPIILNELADSVVQYPLLFRVNVSDSRKVTHCGVLEFTARTGFVIMPEWIMKNLDVKENEIVNITNVTLSPATFIKLQPQSVDFLDIFDPKAVLEKTLRTYSAVTKGENILIRYNNKDYLLKVLEIEPRNQNAVSIVEADVNVEFAAPVGYVEPTHTPQTQSRPMITPFEADPSDLDPSQVVDSDEEDVPKKKQFTPFAGSGAKISGKPITSPTTSTTTTNTQKPAEEKKPYLINGTIQNLTQAEYDAHKQKQQTPSGQTPRSTTPAPKAEQKPPTTTTFSGKGYSLK